MDWTKADLTARATANAWAKEGGPGGVILIFDSDSIRTEVYGGFADLGVRRLLDQDTAFRFASITKHLTATAALLAQDAGVIDLHAPVSAVLSDASDPVGKTPLARAMDMTGGLADILDTAWLLGTPRTALLDANAALRFGLSLTRINFHPGTEFSYSNTGYAFLEAALAERDLPPVRRTRWVIPPCSARLVRA